MPGPITSKKTSTPAAKSPTRSAPTRTTSGRHAPSKPHTGNLDKTAAPKKEEKPRSGFGGFLNNLTGSFGAGLNRIAEHASEGTEKLKEASKPIYEGKPQPKNDTPEAQREAAKAAERSGPNGEPSYLERQRAAATMDRLAGKDGVWDKTDLPRNMAQLQGANLFERAAMPIARNKVLDQFGIPDSERSRILEKSRSIQVDKSERVSLSNLRGMGGVSEDLQARMKEHGIDPPPPGTPVDAGQYRGLLEGRSPLATQVERMLGAASRP